MPSVSPGITSRLIPESAVDAALPGVELDAQVAQAHYRITHQRDLSFGLNASLSPSPTSDTAKTVTKIASPGSVTGHQASRM